ncbi:RluA family pseudouridine synthase [Candidatus Saccharibacteria bacterium]|nr:RluA family pseudouridine synthase [Candidatus Saccharibacteria bacterium]
MYRPGKKFSKPELSRVINGDIEIPEDSKKERKRADLILVEQYKEYNRSTLQNFIKSGYVSLDGQIIKKPNAELEMTEDGTWPKLTLKVPKRQTPPDAEIIYEDDNVLVINKPAGLLSMAKGEWTAEPTLEDYGLLVHRLDRDTSGVVILAKNEATQSFLRKQFQDRKAHKIYYAIVEGRPKLPEAKIDLPIERSIKSPTTFIVSPSGKPSVTFYKVIKSNDKYSLLELKPITGRTHQLRVHLKYLGHPILGDRVYGEQKAPRLFLHATSLEITLPGGERKTFTSPLPEDFKNVLR